MEFLIACILLASAAEFIYQRRHSTSECTPGTSHPDRSRY